jgi:hypothetical protein
LRTNEIRLELVLEFTGIELKSSTLDEANKLGYNNKWISIIINEK